LESISGKGGPRVEKQLDTVKGVRDFNWGSKGEVIELGDVNHSGKEQQIAMQVQKAKRMTEIRKTVKKMKGSDKDKELCIVIRIRNAVDKHIIGEVRIELDELIDPKLRDLAKEYCVALDRTEILNNLEMKQGSSANEAKKEEIRKAFKEFTKYSGIIRFQTFFKPTLDTRLRYGHTRNISQFETPSQILHYEYLIEQSDFDKYKFRIPMIDYNPSKSFGHEFVNNELLVNQCKGHPKIRELLMGL